MKYQEFIKATVMCFDSVTVESLKKSLVGEYISFSIIPETEISKSVLAEKLCDYFEKLELKTGKDFDRQLDAYKKDIDSIVARRIAKTPVTKKNDPTPVVVPRSRKYYEKALAIKHLKEITLSKLTDYSRIMFCLYIAENKAKTDEIVDFDYSVKCIDMKAIIDAMKNESDMIMLVKKNRFDIKNSYCSDTCTFIISIIFLHKIINDAVQGEYYHE